MAPVHSPPVTPQKPRKRTKEGSKPHADTPHRAKVQGAIEIVSKLVEESARPSNRKIFQHFNVPQKTGSRWLHEPARTQGNQDDKLEVRGGHNASKQSDLDRAKEVVDSGDIQDKSISWGALAHEIWPCNPPQGKQVQRRMKQEGYCKFKAAQRPEISEEMRKLRVGYAQNMLSKYPRPWDWIDVLFSDETHCNYKGPGAMHIIRKVGTRDLPPNIQEQSDDHGDLHEPRVHFWGAIGFNFKSLLIRYDIPTNSNGKMTKRVYIDAILEPHVQHWFGGERDFVLEEDGDSGHGNKKEDNLVAEFKTQHGIKTFRNCPQSPDLVCIENSWQDMKFQLRESGHWDDNDTVEIAQRYWATLSQHTINCWVLSSPLRLQRVIDGNGYLIGDCILSTRNYIQLLEEKGFDYNAITQMSEDRDVE